MFVDTNFDGFDDTLASAALKIETEETNATSTSTETQIATAPVLTQKTENTGGGCSIGSEKDPAFPLIVLIMSGIIFIREKKFSSSISDLRIHTEKD